MDTSLSGLSFYSVGIVTTTKPGSQVYIDVWPVEHFPLQQGLISSLTDQLKVSFEDRKGGTQSSSVERKVTIRARWLPLAGSNRLTPPDVSINETVMLLRYKDTGEYYWVTLMVEPKLRRLEHVTYAYSNQSGPQIDNEMSKDTSYHMTVSTRDKKVHLSTPDNDGEFTTYDISIDTNEGILTITDGRDNHITINSAKDSLDININQLTTLTVPELVSNNESVIVNSPEVTVNAETVTVNAETVIVNAAQTTVTSGSVTVDATEVIVNSPTITLNGAVSVTGALTVAGGMAVTGTGPGGASSSLSGPVQVDGVLSATGDVSSTVSMTAPIGNFPNLLP